MNLCRYHSGVSTLGVEGGPLLKWLQQPIVVILQFFMAASLLHSSARTWYVVLVQALSPLAERISAFLVEVVVRLALSATLAITAASGKQPTSSDWKNFGHRLQRLS